jgi:ATP-dependent Lhr-like helicase
VEALRQSRHAGNGEVEIVISGADPLNLTGIVTPGERVAAVARNRILYRNGIPVAVQAAGEFTWLGEPDPAKEWAARNALLKAGHPAGYAAPSHRPM